MSADPHRRAAASHGAMIALASVVVVAVLLAALGRPGGAGQGSQLTVYCAAGLAPAVKEAAEQYEKQFAVTIHIDSASSGALLSRLELESRGDLYIPADRMFRDLARQRGYIEQSVGLAKFRLCIAVAKDNPKNIQSLNDLLRDDVSFGIANDNAAAGVKVRQMLEVVRQWQAVRQQARVSKPTVTEVAQDVQIGSVDAALVWDATARQFGLDVVRISELEQAWGYVDASVLKSTANSAEALRFAQYLADPEKGQPVFQKLFYSPITGNEP